MIKFIEINPEAHHLVIIETPITAADFAQMQATLKRDLQDPDKTLLFINAVCTVLDIDDVRGILIKVQKEY